jgi:hypothetical protein
MNVLDAFWLSASVAVGIAILIVLLLRRPLDVLLVELCGTAGRARFWSVFSSVSIVLTALLGMLVCFPLSEGREWAEHPQLPLVLAAFRSSLFFLLLALGALGFILLLGIGSYERRRRYDAQRGLEPAWGGAAPPPVRS